MSIVVSESAAEETLQAYAHPLEIQAKAISELEKRLLDGQVINDGNNVFTFLMEYAANMTADVVNKTCTCFNSLYPENAQTATDLYKHLSDFDYIGLFATPAQTTVELVFDRNFLIDNAVAVDNQAYYKIVIPEYSKFTIGEHAFGLMYPIEIRVRKVVKSNGRTDYDNCVITVMWDTSVANPLKTLESHILEHRDFVQENQALTAIEVPIYQFSIDNHVEDAIASTGFAKRYDYADKFYAIRVFHFKGGAWHEMAQTLSDINYDIDVPTAMIKVLMDIGKVEVVIPQIYFNTENTSASLGNRVLVKIYTTEGEMNLDTSNYNINQYQASFLLTDAILIEDDTYSNMLKRIPTIFMIPKTKRIASGTDGIDMPALKERVKHSASYTVKITPNDLSAYFGSSGFTFTKVLDNITDRVYCAHKVLTDATGTTIAAGQGVTHFTDEMFDIQHHPDTNELYVPNYSAISVLDENCVTIQPSAIYKYDPENNYFVMISDDEWAIFKNQTVDKQIEQLNAGLYTYSPFHVRLSLDTNMPIAGSYDMYNPKLADVVFDWENPNTTAEIAIYNAGIKVLNTGESGYRLSVALFKTENIADVKALESDGVDVKNIEVMLSTTNSKGVYLYMLGTYNGKDANNHDIFIFDIKTKGKITQNSMFDVTNMYDATGDATDNFLDLGTSKFSVTFFLKEDMVPLESQKKDAYLMDGVSLVGVPGSLDGFIKLCTQSFKLSFGTSLPMLENNVSISASGQSYLTYPTTMFSTYPSQVYERYTVIDYVEGRCSIEKIGTLKLERDPETGKYSLVVKHDVGDVIISSPYGMTYGPTFLFTDVDTEATALITQDEPFTVTSNANNTWHSIDGNIMVTDTSNSRLVGLYCLVDAAKEGEERSWKKTCYTTEEIFDVAPITGTTPTVQIWKYIDENGSVRYKKNQPGDDSATPVIMAIAGLYNNTNGSDVKAKVAKKKLQEFINTNAKGTNRKWFHKDFDYDTFQGFVVEYGITGTDATGITKGWVLDYYYRYTTEEGYVATDIVCVGNLSSLGLNATDRKVVENDSYASIYTETTQIIIFDPTVDDGYWCIGEVSGNEEGQTVYYRAKVSAAMGILDPWEYTNWTAVEGVATGVPTVYSTSNSTNNYSIRTTDALKFILDYVANTKSAYLVDSSALFKYIDEGFLTTDKLYTAGKVYYEMVEDLSNQIHPHNYVVKKVELDTPVEEGTYEVGEPKLVDRLPELIFAFVETADVNRTQEYTNSLINYTRGTDAVGTADAKGALYYKDPEAMAFNPADYNLTPQQLASIVEVWSKYASASETDRYAKILEETGITTNIASKVVSDTKPCYFSPWRKLVTASSLAALNNYYNGGYDSETGQPYGRVIVNCLASEISDYQTKLRAGVQTVADIEATRNVSHETGDIMFVTDITVDGTNADQCAWCGITVEPGKESQATALFAADGLFGTTTAPTCGLVLFTETGIRAVRCGYDYDTCAEVVLGLCADSGYITVITETNPNSPEIVNEYINYLSLVDREYGLEDGSSVNRCEFNVNFESTTWAEIDAWPWEYKNRWIKLHYDYEAGVTGSVASIETKFDTNITAAKLAHLNTDVLHDSSGNPIVDASNGRSLIYHVNMIHCDYKLTMSDDADYVNYVSDIRELLRSYFNELNTVSPSLLARTKLYFAPIRTFGNAQFKSNGGTEITLPLEFSIGLGLHVESYVDGSDLNKETIKNTILNLIDKRLKEGYLNLALLARDIMNGLSDNIICVDVLGIDGDSSLQTMLPVSEDCYPQLKQVLVLNDDGSIHTTRRLDLTWSVIS